MELALQFLVPLLSATFAAGGAYLAVRVEIAWIKKELDDHDDELKVLHSRINAVISNRS